MWLDKVLRGGYESKEEEASLADQTSGQNEEPGNGVNAGWQFWEWKAGHYDLSTGT